MNNEELKEQWSNEANVHLKGKIIKNVRWLTQEEVDSVGFYRSAPVIEFEDGGYIFASQDDEGNDAGALFTSFEDLSTLPVI